MLNVEIPFTSEALKANLERLQTDWNNYQSSRDRYAIFSYLSSVLELVMWWSHECKAKDYARQALRLQRPAAPKIADPFAAIIFCTADREKVDFKMRSKWSRVLRYAKVFKDPDEPLIDFVQRRGGINQVAWRYGRRLGRSQKKLASE